MSNQAVGGVYQTIIEEVINSSRVDFEESGVEEAVLEELRLVSTAVIRVPLSLPPFLFISINPSTAHHHDPTSGVVTASSLCIFCARSRNRARFSARKSNMLRAILVAP